MARMMVVEWGMSERLGFVHWSDELAPPRHIFDLGMNKELSQKTAEIVDEEVKRIIDAAYADARRMLEAHREPLEAIAQGLLKYETLSGEEVRKVLAGEKLDMPTVADLIAAEQDRARPEAPPMARPVQRPPSDGEVGPLPTPA